MNILFNNSEHTNFEEPGYVTARLQRIIFLFLFPLWYWLTTFSFLVWSALVMNLRESVV